MDKGGWSKELTTQLLGLYRDNPCLWKVKDKRYLNKNLRNAAYDKLVELCRTAFPEANRDFVSKRIQSLRGSFRKELKKVRSARSGSAEDDHYTPSLWYYDLLLFTADSENAAGSIDNLDTEQDNQGQTEENDQTHKDSQQDETDAVPSVSSHLEKDKPANNQFFYEPPSKRTKKAAFEATQMQFMRTCAKALEATTSSTEVNEFEAIAMVVKKKLERMDPEQALMAENLINDVLRRGLLKQLSESTVVLNPNRDPPSSTWTPGTGSSPTLNPYALIPPSAPPFNYPFPSPAQSPVIQGPSGEPPGIFHQNDASYTVL